MSELLHPATLQNLELIARGRPEFLPQLMRTFAEQGRGLSQGIVAASQSADAPALSAAAHKLGGSCANIGALALRDDCVAIERAAGAGEIDRPAAVKVARDFEVLVAHLEARFG